MKYREMNVQHELKRNQFVMSNLVEKQEDVQSTCVCGKQPAEDFNLQ